MPNCVHMRMRVSMSVRVGVNVSTSASVRVSVSVTASVSDSWMQTHEDLGTHSANCKLEGTVFAQGVQRFSEGKAS